MSTLAYAVTRLAHDAAAQPAARMRRYPSMTLMLIGIPVILLLLFVYVFGGTLGAGLGGVSGGRAEYANYVMPGILLISHRERRHRNGDLGRDGHDRRHHRPVQDHGDLPPVRADRPRARQRDPDRAQPGRRHRGRAAGRLPARRRPWSNGSPPPGSSSRLSFAITWLSVALGLVVQDRRGRQQPAHAADPPAVPRQRLRAHRVDADRRPVVRRVPALHPDHGDACAACCSAPRIGNNAWLAVAWCVAITVVGYVWARRLYNRDPSR